MDADLDPLDAKVVREVSESIARPRARGGVHDQIVRTEHLDRQFRVHLTGDGLDLVSLHQRAAYENVADRLRLVPVNVAHVREVPDCVAVSQPFAVDQRQAPKSCAREAFRQERANGSDPDDRNALGAQLVSIET
jgi:hypothetical protein